MCDVDDDKPFVCSALGCGVVSITSKACLWAANTLSSQCDHQV